MPLWPYGSGLVFVPPLAAALVALPRFKCLCRLTRLAGTSACAAVAPATSPIALFCIRRRRHSQLVELCLPIASIVVALGFSYHFLISNPDNKRRLLKRCEHAKNYSLALIRRLEFRACF